jgi:hypothetical protein
MKTFKTSFTKLSFLAITLSIFQIILPQVYAFHIENVQWTNYLGSSWIKFDIQGIPGNGYKIYAYRTYLTHSSTFTLPDPDTWSQEGSGGQGDTSYSTYFGYFPSSGNTTCGFWVAKNGDDTIRASNIVGFIIMRIASNGGNTAWKIISNPFIHSPPVNVNQIMDHPYGSNYLGNALYFWNSSSLTYNQTNVWSTDGASWYWNPSSSLYKGNGEFYSTIDTADLYMAGILPLKNLSTTIGRTNYTSSMVIRSAYLDNLSFPTPDEFDVIRTWNENNQDWDTSYTYYSGDWSPSTPFIEPGMGFRYETTNTTSKTWTQTATNLYGWSWTSMY